MKIIAEIGSNWNSLNDCLHSIAKAKECGADIVKFQMFTKNELYGPPIMGEYSAMNFASHIPILKAEADKVGIEFMCTAFSVEGYKYLDPYVLRHKVASSECTHPQILDYLNTTGKEVLLSVAGAEIDAEIKPALERLKDVPVCIMHCVGDYPARSFHAEKFCSLRNLNYRIGYSDHTLEIDFLENGMMNDLAYLEKHVTFIKGTTPDSTHSLDEEQFKFFTGHNMSLKKENLLNQDMIKIYRRRLIALRTIEPGEKLELDVNVGIFRGTKATTNHIKPLDKWQGLEVKKQVAKGYAVTWSDI